jgi:hypothetical protein
MGLFPRIGITDCPVLVYVVYSLESSTRQKEIAFRYLQPGRRLGGGLNAEDMT